MFKGIPTSTYGLMWNWKLSFYAQVYRSDENYFMHLAPCITPAQMQLQLQQRLRKCLLAGIFH